MRKSKRGLLSLLLTLAMVLTMLPTTALAVDVAPVDTAPTDAAAPAEPETAPAPEETPEEPAPDAGADADVDANADEPAEAPEEPAETPEAPAEDAEPKDEAPAPEETTPPADADTGADAEAPEAPEEPAGQPEETPAPEEEPKDEEPDGVTAPAADKVLDSGPVPITLNPPKFEDVQIVPDADEFPDSDELFAGYVESVMYGDDGAALFSTVAGNNLEGLMKTFYDALVPEFEKIANGTRTNTQITIPYEIRPTEAGLSSNTITNQADLDKFYAYLNAQFDMDWDLFLSAILADCPYDLYWFDKTVGYGIKPTGEMIWGGQEGYFPVNGYRGTYTFSFTVAQAYATGTYTTDATKTSATTTAVNNAKAIVEKYKGEDVDWKKLKAYKDEICNLTSYNHAAVENPNTPYGDPWQLIYVFDGKPSTEVVCEGYAKAFQYLCDLSTFTSGNILCYTVTGPMGGGTGAGPHMWNVVRMDNNKNYIVDVTNCDEGTIGAPDDLFLAGVASSDGGRTYSFPIKGVKINFSYDAEMQDLHVPGWLVLDTDYYPIHQITLEATAATVKQKTFDGISFADVTSVSFKNVEDNSVVELVLGADYDALANYVSPNAGTDKAEVAVAMMARGYKLKGADDKGIVKLPVSNVTAPAILKAKATMKVELSTNQQKRGKPVEVKVTAKHANTALAEVAAAQPKGVTMEGVTLSAKDGAFAGTYNIAMDAALGKKTFTATLNDTNFEPLTASADLEILDKGPVTITLTADKTSVTYGDTVNVTAKVAKTNADDTDTLAGKLTLYLGDKAIGTPIEDLTKEITVTLDKADLKAGTHTLKADFVSGNNFFASNNKTLDVTVAKKALTWDVSGITIAVKNDENLDLTVAPEVQGKDSLGLIGKLEGDDVDIDYNPADLTAPKFTITGPGSEDMTLILPTKALKGADKDNYDLPGDIVVKATINAVNEVKNPEEGEALLVPDTKLEEGEDLKLEMEDGISQVPDNLKNNPDRNTPAKIIGALKQKIEEIFKEIEDNFAFYDVELLYRASENDPWVPAKEEHFPITITLPYPDNADRSFDFTVTHMNSTTGEVERLTPVKTNNGLKVKVTSLSPIAIAWQKPTYSGGGSGGGGSNYSGDVWEKIEKKIEEADKGDRIEAKVYDENMPVSTMQALYDDGGVTLVIKWNGEDIIIPAGKALNPSTEAGRIYYPLSYLAELYKGSKIPTGNAGNPETGGVWVITAPTYDTPATPVPSEPVPVPEAVEPTPEPEAPKAPETPTATAPVQPEEPVNSSSKVGTIVALLALMAAAAAGAYFLYKKRNDDGLYTK